MEFQGIQDGDPTAFQLAPRAGYPVSANQYFSAAPLPTSRHIEYLSQLEDKLAPKKPRNGAKPKPSGSARRR
jgi:hypothetical protein